MAITAANPLPSTAGCDEGNCVRIPSSMSNSERDIERCPVCGSYVAYFKGTRAVRSRGYMH
jgi:hypothetical protein